ncbi:Vph2p SCDLUD_004009 [Saccharomycodes ludwigii]|uniref:Vph2p n=1 Tax=Saccharomycodes ludwigii TaxID=36035 RepID=UPI001E88052B|nr:hypothetical protein SCDLUD_004009 [Saccharomycodes ludwigii]KAH3899723.1 hypothetical protein SCDLUD_004009 [Saccharomycodes ludwigii]
MFEIRLNDNIEKLLLKTLQNRNTLIKIHQKIEDSVTYLTTANIQKILSKKSIKCGALAELLEINNIKETPLIPQNNGIDMSAIFTPKQPLEWKFKETPKPGSNYSPEFKAQLETLRARQQEVEYQNMVTGGFIGDNNDNSSGGNRTITNRFKKGIYADKSINYNDIDDEELSLVEINRQIKEQLTTVFNIIISVISVVWAVWYWAGKYVSVEYKVLLCLFFGILVLVADIVVYNSYLRKINEAKKVERSKKEKKRITKKIIVGTRNTNVINDK